MLLMYFCSFQLIFRWFCFPWVMHKQTPGEDSRLMASCVRNIRTKNYKNWIFLLQVTIDNILDVFFPDTVYISIKKNSSSMICIQWQLHFNASKIWLQCNGQ